MTRPIPQSFHNSTVTLLMWQANGDLILDRRGNLCTRNVWDDDELPGKELPWQQHRPGMRLATLSGDGWTVTRDGAQFILENCPPDRAADCRKLNQIISEAREAVLVGLAGAGE